MLHLYILYNNMFISILLSALAHYIAQISLTFKNTSSLIFLAKLFISELVIPLGATRLSRCFNVHL